MSERVSEYNFTDEEGYKYKLNYISRNCMCSSNCCYEDSLELFEDGEDIPYRLDIEGSDIKWLIKCLIDGDINPKLIKELTK